MFNYCQVTSIKYPSASKFPLLLNNWSLIFLKHSIFDRNWRLFFVENYLFKVFYKIVTKTLPYEIVPLLCINNSLLSLAVTLANKVLSILVCCLPFASFSALSVYGLRVNQPKVSDDIALFFTYISNFKTKINT